MIQLPKDADGREIPLDTKVLYGSGGTARNTVYWVYTVDSDLEKEWGNCWRAVTFERVLECVGYTEGNVFDYLADLVDRGECENVYDGSVQDSCDNGFLCSVCGCKVEDEEHYRVSGVWNYCPQCGRKVRHG